MGRTLVWVTDGPKAGEFLEMDEEDADRAEGEGWVQRTVDSEGRQRDGVQMRKAVKGPHEKAEAYLNRKPGYTNRELRSSPSPAPASAPVTESQEEEKPKRAGGRRPST